MLLFLILLPREEWCIFSFPYHCQSSRMIQSLVWYFQRNQRRICCCSIAKSYLTLTIPWTAECQAPLSFTFSQSLLKFISIESVMPSNHLILCCPLLLLPSVFPNVRVFSNEYLFASGGISIGSSASASVLPMNNQGWLPLGLVDLISLQCVE